MRKFLVVGSLFLVFGCNNPSNPVDAAMAGDAAVVVDAAALPDAGGGACAPTCDASHVCLRGTCVLPCGADASALDAALGAGLVVQRSVCRTPAALTIVGTNAYELTASTVARTTTFTLSRWPLGSETPSASTVASATYTAPDSSTMAFAGGYVAVAPDEMHAVFGYTTTLSGAIGGVFDVDTGTGMSFEDPSDGNFDAAYLDTVHYVIDAAPGGMQGLYMATHTSTPSAVVTHLGEYSGSVAYWADEDVVLAGGTSIGTNWANGTPGQRVVVVNTMDIVSGTAPTDASTVQQLEIPSAFELLSGGRVASVHYDASFAIDGIESRTLTRASGTGTVSVSSPTNLASGAVFSSVAASGSDIVLGFAGGLLFVH